MKFNETGKQSKPSDAFIKGQGDSIQGKLTEVGFDELSVHPRSIRRRVRDRGTGNMRFGYVADIDPTTIATFVSSEANKQPISTVFIVPTEIHSGLLAHDESNRLFTDSFWEKKGNELRHITPHKPVPLDGVGVNLDLGIKIDPVIKAHYPETVYKFMARSEDKNSTKQILEAAGIRVPRGILINPLDPAADGEEMNTRFKNFSESLPEGKEVVFKPNNGVCGENVIMGDPYSETFFQQVNTMLQKLSRETESFPFLVEERIIPPSLPALIKNINSYLDRVDLQHNKERATMDNIDFNFRILLTLGYDPQVIDAEIRFGEKGNGPINISKNAKALRTDALEDPELVGQIYTTAQKAIKAMYQANYVQGDPFSTPLFVGVDIILDSHAQNECVVNEVQFGPGGFGTLAKIDKKPNTGIANVFIPTQVTSLKSRFESRQPIKPGELRRLPLDGEEELVRYRSYCQNRNYNKALEAFSNAVFTEGYSIGWTELEILDEFMWFGKELGDYTSALRYAHKLASAYPENAAYQYYFYRFKAESTQKLSYYQKTSEALYQTTQQDELIETDINATLDLFAHLASLTNDYTHAFAYASDLINNYPDDVWYGFYKASFKVGLTSHPDDYKNQAEALYKLTQKYNVDPERTFSYFNTISEQTGDYVYAYTYAADLLKEDSGNALKWNDWCQYFSYLYNASRDHKNEVYLACAELIEKRFLHKDLDSFTAFLAIFERIGNYTGNYDHALGFVNGLLKKDPENAEYQTYKEKFEKAHQTAKGNTPTNA